MIDILMPRLSDTMTEGAIAAWHKQPGDTVQPGDTLVEIETDKALMEQEAYDAGTLVEILVAEGENVAIGTPIARLDDGNEQLAPSGPPAQSAPPAESGGPAPSGRPEEAEPAPVAAPGEQPRWRAATPIVRRLARERGIDLARLTGTGPGGRIVRADLDSADHSAPSPSSTPNPRPVALGDRAEPAAAADARDSRRIPFDAVRQAIATRLTESATTIPSFTATATADVGELLALRRRVNEANADAGVKVSVNDLLVRAVAIALRAHPGVNASYDAAGAGHALVHDRVHIGIAVASPAGLVVPVIRDADRASVTTIATTTRLLVGKADERTLSTADMRDGTFTISNLGMFGVEHFTAIINPPQGAILAVGAVRAELALVDGEVRERHALRLSLTSDHRIIDGVDAAGFLATLSRLLEHPLRVLS